MKLSRKDFKAEAQTYLKAANPSVVKWVGKEINKAIVGGKTFEELGYTIDNVDQVVTSPSILNEFELRRTELESKGHGLESANKKLQTVNAYLCPEDDKMDQIVTDGFFKTYEGARIAFPQDPVQAIREGFSQSRKLLICRVVLGQHELLNNKYIVKNSKGCMASFIVYFSSGGD
mmetsp:Transcript_30448/g.76447  ORF Transcript_30448/g.76447 Transcript_30448/m.76447 type:complete len:175 (+) Transcript_30448:113-637(+)